jgi:hypothetical protein
MIDAVNLHGSNRAAAAALGLSGDGNISREIAKVLQKARVGGYGTGETLAATTVPVGGKTRRFLLTAAQDETQVHAPFWRNLHAYAGPLAPRCWSPASPIKRASSKITPRGRLLCGRACSHTSGTRM